MCNPKITISEFREEIENEIENAEIAGMIKYGDFKKFFCIKMTCEPSPAYLYQCFESLGDMFRRRSIEKTANE